MADERPLPPPRPPELGAPEKAQAEPSPPAPKGDAASTCLTKLIADSVSAEAASAPATPVEGCGIDAPVRLSSIMVEGGAVSLPDRPLVACEFAAVLADYVRLIVAPLGQAMLHAKVAEIETGPGYTCRTQDRIAGAKISAHGKGLAVDLSPSGSLTSGASSSSGRRARTRRPTSALYDRRVRLVHDRPRSRLRRLSRQQHASRYRTARIKRQLSHLRVIRAHNANELTSSVGCASVKWRIARRHCRTTSSPC